ncbi:MAG: nuclear transport factor 2-like protein [Saccharofermentanales bacterium]
MKSQKQKNFMSCLLLSLLLALQTVLFSSCSSPYIASDAAFDETGAMLEALYAGWIAEDPDAVIDLYADDVYGVDAMLPGWSYDKKEADEMLLDPSFWSGFDLREGIFFISPDGKFAANVTTMSFKNSWGDCPHVSTVVLRDGQVIYQYDCYGSAMSKTGAMPAIEPMTVRPESREAKKAARQAFQTVQKWQKAFNDRNSTDYLSCYADDAEYIDMVSPDWRILSKDELADDVATRFLRSEFTTRLEAPETSMIPGGFFISADGHYAMIQGIYNDINVTASTFAVILEIESAKIIRQYNYLIITAAALQP